MGAVIGMPPSLGEIYRTDIRKMYKAGQIPMSYGVLSSAAASLIHLMILSGIICLSAPVIFDVSLPEHLAEIFWKSNSICCGIFKHRRCDRVRDFGSGKNSNGFTDGISAVHYAVWYYVSGRLSSKDAQNGGRSFPSVLAYRWITGEGSLWKIFCRCA